MGYIDTPGQRRAIQAALNEKLQLDPPLVVDGILGPRSADAIIRARSTFNLDHVGEPLVDTDLERELGLLAIQAPVVVAIAKTQGIDLLTLIGLIGPIQRLLKGDTTMTSDQITGIIRLVLGLIGGYFISKGLVSQSLFDWISAGVLTAVPGVWSWLSNRPKTIVPIASK